MNEVNNSDTKKEKTVSDYDLVFKHRTWFFQVLQPIIVIGFSLIESINSFPLLQEKGYSTNYIMIIIGIMIFLMILPTAITAGLSIWVNKSKSLLSTIVLFCVIVIALVINGLLGNGYSILQFVGPILSLLLIKDAVDYKKLRTSP